MKFCKILTFWVHFLAILTPKLVIFGQNWVFLTKNDQFWGQNGQKMNPKSQNFAKFHKKDVYSIEIAFILL